MFRRREESSPTPILPVVRPADRVTSVIGQGISVKGSLNGSGGLRIEGAFEGDIALRGLVVIGETGRVTCEHLRANTVVVAGAVRGDITAEKLEIRKTGRVWGNVVTASFATEEGAFLRGQIRMEEQVDLGLSPQAEAEAASTEDGSSPSPPAPSTSQAELGRSEQAPLPPGEG